MNAAAGLIGTGDTGHDYRPMDMVDIGNDHRRTVTNLNMQNTSRASRG
jgi:hypothetical protein